MVLVGMQSEEVRVFIRERKPTMSKEAGKLADDFLQSRREGKAEGDKKKQESGKSGDHTVRRCLKCGISGHSAKKDSTQPERDLRDVECFNCHRNVPIVLTMQCSVDYKVEVTVTRRPVVANPGRA